MGKRQTSSTNALNSKAYGRTVSRILIASTEILPTLACPTVGGSQRTHALGEALRERGHDVVYSVPLEQLQGKNDVPQELLDTAHSEVDLGEIVKRVAPDVLLFAAPYLARFVQDSKVPTVMDLAANVELETAFASGENLADVLMGRLDQYRRGDLFILGSPRQLYWYSGFLMLSGIHVENDCFTVIPICCSPQQPPIPDRDELRFLCAGMFYPWQDPFKSLGDVLSTLEARGTGELHIFTGREHPGWKSISSQLIDPRAKLKESDRLSIRGVLPFGQAIDEWGKYSCAVDVMKPNLERLLANPMRTTTYLWLGIPVIISDFYWISDLVKKYDAGWLVNHNDEGAVKRIVDSIIDDPSILDQRAINAKRLVAEELTWDKHVDGLDEFCRAPRKLLKSANLVSIVAGELTRMYADHLAIAKEIGRVQGELEFWREKADGIEKELEDRDTEVAHLRKRIDDILNSRTWRTTQFLKHKLLRIAKDKPTDRRES